MITGIGLDIVEIPRVAKALAKSERFAERILSEREQSIFQTLSASRKIEFLAGRFAAKEAFSKARGSGIGKDCTFHQIEVLKGEKGEPQLYFDESLVLGFVSITHTKEYAAAQVVLVQKV